MAEESYLMFSNINSANLEEPDIYAEDDDASVAVPFGLVSLTAAKVSNPPTPEKSAVSDFSNFHELQLDQNAQYPSSEGMVESNEESAIEKEGPLEHCMWKEAKGALRFFGTFSKLPVELQEVILDYCGPTTLLKWMQINPSARFIGIQDRFWEKLFATDYPGVGRQTTDPKVSWLKNYRMAYYYSVSAKITAPNGTYSSWNYEKSSLSVPGLSRRWQWHELKCKISLPSFKSAFWKPTTNQLIFDSKVFNFDPSNGRFSSRDSPMTAQANFDKTSFPPSARISIWTRFGTLGQIIVIGTIPIPLLMCIIFRIE